MLSFNHSRGTGPRRGFLVSDQLALEALEARCLLGGGVWRIVGDANDANLNDRIVIDPVPDNPAMLQATVNGEVVETRLAADVRKIIIKAGKGDDLVRIDLPDTSIPAKLIGGRGADTLEGGGGDDKLIGRRGNDLLFGGGGNDKLFGGSGMDRLQGDDGQDRLVGGRGKDLFFGDTEDDNLKINRKDLLVGKPEDVNIRRVGSEIELKQWLVDSAIEQWQGLLGQQMLWRGWYEGTTPVFMAAPGGADMNRIMTDSAAPGTDYSQTNTQEEGVDEADLVKTDGEYLYLFSGEELVVMDAWPADELAVVSRTAVEGRPVGLYLYEDFVTVVAVSQPAPPPWLFEVQADMMYYPGAVSEVIVTTLDVSDRENPAVVQETTFDGRLVESRAIEDRLYLVLQNNFPLPRPILDTDSPEGDYVYESEQAYRQRLSETIMDQELPQYSTLVGGEAFSAPLAQAPNIYIPPEARGQDLLCTAILDVNGDNETGERNVVVPSTSIFGVHGEVYASTDNLYVVSTAWSLPWRRFAEGPVSHIYQFGLGVDDVSLEATGAVPGSVLNQFSMDEEAGFFRIATTGAAPTDRQANNLFVLASQSGHLHVVGSLTGLAPGERIRSARFMGDRGFLVTFRNVDPLFTLDLSDPTDPTVVGELKIPGFSSYLHPVGQDHLIGLGRNVNPETNRDEGMQLSLFDVSDFANPVRVDVYEFGEDWSDRSEAEHDHHAFSYFPESGILALPVSEGMWRINGGSGSAGLEVFEVDPEEGFGWLGEIEHDTAVRRSLRIGENLYSISADTVKVNLLVDPDEQLAEVNYAPGADGK